MRKRDLTEPGAPSARCAQRLSSFRWPRCWAHKGGGFQNRRDYAIISVFKDAGARLSKLFGLTTGDMTLGDADCARAASLWGAPGAAPSNEYA